VPPLRAFDRSIPPSGRVHALTAIFFIGARACAVARRRRLRAGSPPDPAGIGRGREDCCWLWLAGRRAGPALAVAGLAWLLVNPGRFSFQLTCCY